MASILCLGFAMVGVLASGIDAQSSRRCSSFPRDTCPIGFNCVNGFCEELSSQFCRSDFDCPRDYECIRRQCRRPRDCRLNPSICGPFETCNRFTGRCEIGNDDCRIKSSYKRDTKNPSICGPFETCNRFTGRCEIGNTDCRIKSSCKRDTENPSICGPFETCNGRTGRCERNDCRVNPSICAPFETCNRRTGRCERIGSGNDCRINPSICGPFENCNIRTGRCESNVNDCRNFPCPFGQSCQYRFGSYQCVSDYCRPFPANDCPPGYYCRRGECVRNFLGASGSTSGGAPGTGTEAADTGSGM